jgi:hypothetical protein
VHFTLLPPRVVLAGHIFSIPPLLSLVVVKSNLRGAGGLGARGHKRRSRKEAATLQYGCTWASARTHFLTDHLLRFRVLVVLYADVQPAPPKSQHDCEPRDDKDTDGPEGELLDARAHT